MAQGFRLCFPEQLSGIGYTADELPEEMTTVRPVNPLPQENDEEWDGILEDWEMVADLARRITRPEPELIEKYNKFMKQIKNHEKPDLKELRIFADTLRERIGYIDVKGANNE